MSEQAITSTSTLWIALDNGGTRTVKVYIDENDDVDDLLSLLKSTKLSDELRGIGLSQIHVKSSSSLQRFRSSEKIKDLPKSTDQAPLIVGTNWPLLLSMVSAAGWDRCSSSCPWKRSARGRGAHIGSAG